MARPITPTAVRLNDMAATDGMHTTITGRPEVSALIQDPDDNDVRLVVQWSTNSDFANFRQTVSDWVNSPHRASVRIHGANNEPLAQNTHYWVRVYAQARNNGQLSLNYNGFNFWTNESSPPDGLTVNGGGSGVSITTQDSALFKWNFNDPNAKDLQKGFEIRYRTSSTSSASAGAWVVVSQPNTAQNNNPVNGPPARSENQWRFDPGTFKSNTFYDWQVRTRDQQNLWSDWSVGLFRLFVSGATMPPLIVSPTKNVAVDVTETITFDWTFRDPDKADHQTRADLRWRIAGQDDTQWITLLGSVTEPGSNSEWDVAAGNFSIGFRYEWQVRTYDTAGNVSDWSASSFFWSIGTPGSESGAPPIPAIPVPAGTLGCGTYRVFVFEQGGERVIGEIQPCTSIAFGRVRDDISVADVVTNGLGDPDCCELYARLRCWIHELVIYRDDVRVWEGPITRITYTTTTVEMEARDVMVYLYRRVMRQGFNDAYRILARNPDGTVAKSGGIVPVLERARTIIANALAPFDPNILPYLTVITGTDDADQGQVVADFQITAWEQIDAFAATAGLDYTVVGRRIILWDTHNAIGRLPALTDGDFSEPPIVSEYGMQLANFMAVTNGQGVAGYVQVDNPDRPSNQPSFYPYGPIEMLASAYSETSTAVEDALTSEALVKLQASLTKQAASNIAGRWPTPLIVRVPDNSTLTAECQLTFQQLIPGVWIPLRSSGTCRMVTQWQKLDSVSVAVDENGEQISVVLSPAPGQGQDPDAGTDDPAAAGDE